MVLRGKKFYIYLDVWICVMFVALTGTPGVGKTTVGGILEEWGFKVIYLRDFEKKCVVGCDENRPFT